MPTYKNTRAFTGLGAVLNFNPVGSPPSWSTIPEVRNQKPSGQMMKSDDATNLQSSAEEFISTIRTSGTWDGESNLVPTDPGYIAMEALFYDGAFTQFMIQFPKAPGQLIIGDQRWFVAFVEKFMPTVIEPTKIIRLEFSLKITNDVTPVAGS